MMGKEVVVAYLMFDPGISLERLKETMKNIRIVS
jgi:hypothetical protein